MRKSSESVESPPTNLIQVSTNEIHMQVSILISIVKYQISKWVLKLYSDQKKALSFHLNENFIGKRKCHN